MRGRTGIGQGKEACTLLGQYVTALLDLIGNRHQWKPGLQFSPRIVVKETNMDINFLVKVY